MSFLDKRKQRKLYQQWVDKSGLPEENVPAELGPERADDEEPWINEDNVGELPRSGRFFVIHVTQRQLLIVLLVIAVLLIISACLATALIMQSC